MNCISINIYFIAAVVPTRSSLYNIYFNVLVLDVLGLRTHIRPKFEAVNLNFRSCFQISFKDWPIVRLSKDFISVKFN